MAGLGLPSEDEGAPGRCPYCGRQIKEDDMFCSDECERNWIGREVAKAEREGILFCPNCGSTRMGLALPGLISAWECKDCGYHGGLAVKDGRMRTAVRKGYEGTRSDKD